MSDISLISVFTASLLGSLHCAGMCGGFVIYNTVNSTSRINANIFYNLGRLITYLVLGLFAGTLGYSLNSTEAFTGMARITSLLVGLLLIYWGLKSFLKNSFPSNIETTGNSKLFGLVSRFYSALLKNEYQLSETNRSLFLGLLSTFLPCGWLYSFSAIAATTAHPLLGAEVMFWFWLGTVPVLLCTAGISNFGFKPIQRFLPRITAILLIIAGLFSLSTHMGIFRLHSHANHSGHEHHMH